MNDEHVPEDRLDSWKEIAAHMRRDVTTVQRWERDRHFLFGASATRPDATRGATALSPQRGLYPGRTTNWRTGRAGGEHPKQGHVGATRKGDKPYWLAAPLMRWDDEGTQQGGSSCRGKSGS